MNLEVEVSRQSYGCEDINHKGEKISFADRKTRVCGMVHGENMMGENMRW